ncbi:MAG: hypothetical protein M3Q95_12560 [Bacteroidota bacterium]|nr:hypothetical protein [Bacteroidota bacterium]
MNKNFIKQEIENLIEVINEQQALVLSYTDKIPQIEMDILMANIRKVYERLMELNITGQDSQMESFVATDDKTASEPVNKQPVEATIAVQPDSSAEEEKVPEIIAETIPLPETPPQETPANFPELPVAPPVVNEVSDELNDNVAEVPSSEKSSTPAPIPTAVTEEVVEEKVVPQVTLSKERVKEFSKPAGRNTNTASLFDDAPTIADKFQGSPTLYDKIAVTKEDKSLAGRLQKNPVSDLKKSIGINEKFSFINELFDGDLDSYNAAIELLNNCKNLNDAFNTLSNDLVPKYNWSDEADSFQQLKNLLERRYIS